MGMKELLFVSCFCFSIATNLMAQEEDLLKTLENDQPKEKVYTQSTFKGTRLANNQTVECLGKRALEFRIAHRFGGMQNGEKDFWGLDQANMNITFDYGLTNRLMVGIGRNSVGKLYEGTLKYKLLAQTENNSMPLTVTLLGKANVLSNTQGAQYDDVANAWSYVSEVMIARKFSKKFSLQISPTLIHINLVPAEFTSNNIFALSGAGRYKFTRSMAITAEYTQTLNNYYDQNISAAQYIPVASIGVDIETGGHVFQVFLTNAATLNETQFIPLTTSDWGRREFRFGFNISRTFSTGKKKSQSTY